MGLFGFFNKKRKVDGELGYYGLADWWFSAFSDEERRYIQNKFKPLGFSSDSLTSGEITSSTQSAVNFLCTLSEWFGKKPERPIAYKILEKAEELIQSSLRVSDAHILYGFKITVYYKDRNNPEYMTTAVQACKQQIAIAPQAAAEFKAEYKNFSLPVHKGYEQLAIILEKEKEFTEVIKLCTLAEEQGWAGDWNKRIERCKKKLEKV